MQVYVQKSTRMTLPCRSAAVSGAEFSQAVALPSEARPLALESWNGFTVINLSTESLVPIHPAASERAATPKKRRRSWGGGANMRLFQEEIVDQFVNAIRAPRDGTTL